MVGVGNNALCSLSATALRGGVVSMHICACSLISYYISISVGVVVRVTVSAIALDCFASLAMTPKPVVLAWRDRYF
jgi:hypothetical protein